jgi:hypothetical protein
MSSVSYEINLPVYYFFEGESNEFSGIVLFFSSSRELVPFSTLDYLLPLAVFICTSVSFFAPLLAD